MKADSDRWIERHWRIKRLLDFSGCLKAGPHHVARGAAAGLFVALIPVFGMQTLLLLLVCIVSRANFPVAFLTSWISNPFTIAGIALTANAVGRAVYGTIAMRFSDAGSMSNLAIEQTLVTLLGSLVIATPAAIVGYAAALWLQHAFDRADR